MTICKADSLLEQEGLLERIRGVGMVLRGDAETRDELIRPAVSEVVMQAKQLGLAQNDLLTKIKEVWRHGDDARGKKEKDDE